MDGTWMGCRCRGGRFVVAVGGYGLTSCINVRVTTKMNPLRCDGVLVRQNADSAPPMTFFPQIFSLFTYGLSRTELNILHLGLMYGVAARDNGCNNARAL